MHVGFNLVFLVPDETGGRETYVRELTRAMREERPDMRLTAFIAREAAKRKHSSWLKEFETVTVPVNTRSRAGWAVGEQVLLPRLAKRAGVDVLHSPANTAPAFGPFRRVVTIHDLLYRRYPELLDPVSRAGTRAIVGTAARTAHRVITGGEWARDEIVSLLGAHAERIDVVPHGFGTPPSGGRTPDAELRARFGLGDRPFVLASAIRVPHKNLPTLIDALALIPKERRPVLTLTGPLGSNDDSLDQRIRERGIADDVRLLGYVDQADLEGLYAGAVCFVFPTLYEGFGLPVLEAMARGLPVACSDIGPLREVTGDAALLFEPRKARSIADAIERLLAEPEERERLIVAGQAQATGFTWQRAARGTIASYERALDPVSAVEPRRS